MNATWELINHFFGPQNTYNENKCGKKCHTVFIQCCPSTTTENDKRTVISK
jgi:hypothetical protein